MNIEGYTLHVPQDQQPDILPRLRGIICDRLNLCASVGCGCTTGDGDPVCRESEAGAAFPIHHSEGPKWAIFIRASDDRISIDIHLTEPVLNIERRDLYNALLELDFPIFPHSVQG